MAKKILIALLWIECLIGSGLNAETLSVTNGLDSGYFSQKAAGPQQTGPTSSEASAPSTREKAQNEKGKEQKPAAPDKKEPPKHFEPTEKVKADQAIDFPADI